MLAILPSDVAYCLAMSSLNVTTHSVSSCGELSLLVLLLLLFPVAAVVVVVAVIVVPVVAAVVVAADGVVRVFSVELSC